MSILSKPNLSLVHPGFVRIIIISDPSCRISEFMGLSKTMSLKCLIFNYEFDGFIIYTDRQCPIRVKCLSFAHFSGGRLILSCLLKAWLLTKLE